MHTHDHLQVNTKERGAIVKRLPSEIFPEYILVRVNEFDKVAVTPLEEWVRYLKDGIITSETTAPGLEEAREKLRYYSMSPEERYAYDEHLNAIMIQNDVLSTAKFEGWEEGRAEERLETARRMRSDGLSMEMVVRYTGLSEEEINNGNYILLYTITKIIKGHITMYPFIIQSFFSFFFPFPSFLTLQERVFRKRGSRGSIFGL